ncbi:hypothetical protein ABPG72_012306 [Tetrahymena utriculariae]
MNTTNGGASTSCSEDTPHERVYTPQTSHIVTQVEPSFFDDIAKDSQLWISNPQENPKIRKMNLSKVILHEGYLQKKSRDEQHMFKARYFVLYEDRLEVFRDQKEMKTQRASNIMLLGAVRLDLRPICEEDLRQLNEKERYFLMFLSCKMRFFLFAKDQEIYNEWVKNLKKACILTNFSQMYENIKILGKGTFAKVFLTKLVRGGQEFAVKTFDKRALLTSKNSEKTRTGLLNEIQILRKCDHPNIIKLYEVYESDNYIYLVQNVLKGGELFDTIIKNGNFSEKNAAKIIHQLLSALEYIHAKNIMHRDIKPENLILVDKSDEFQIKLADFGLAAFTSDDLLFKRCGTPGYVAPEILEDKKYDQKVDVFSSGVILYILLTGCSPFYGKSYNEILSKNKNCQISYDFNELGVKVSQEATELLKKMLDVDPKTRITASQALNHRFFTKYFGERNLNTSQDEFDTGNEESTAYENMRLFQTQFNVQNIKPHELKPQDSKGLVSMTPMLGGRNLDNPQGDDIRNPTEKWMSPQKKIRPGDYVNIQTAVTQNDYLQRLVAKPTSEKYEFKQTATIPETPIVKTDNRRVIQPINIFGVTSNNNNTKELVNQNNNNNNNATKPQNKDLLIKNTLSKLI